MYLVHATTALVHTLIRPLVTMSMHWWDKKHPIFLIEIARPIPRQMFKGSALDTPATRSLMRFIGKGIALVRVPLVLPFVMLILLMLVPSIILLEVFLLLLLLMFPFTPWLWRVPTVFSATVPLAREIEKRRWTALRSTLYSTQEIIQALHAAGTYRVERLWFFVTIMRMVLGGGLMLQVLPGGVAGQVAQFRPVVINWVAYVLSFLYLLTEPLLDVGVDGALGILAATFSRTQLGAVVNGFLLRLSLWTLQALSLLLILPVAHQVLTPAQVRNVPALVILGPAYGLLLGLSPLATSVMVVAVSVLRLLGLHVFLRVAVWRAEMVAV